jgi:hypothetical protein
VKRSELSWSASPRRDVIIESGSDVADLARYKDVLFALRSSLNDGEDRETVSNAKREQLEQRLLLLEH